MDVNLVEKFFFHLKAFNKLFITLVEMLFSCEENQNFSDFLTLGIEGMQGSRQQQKNAKIKNQFQKNIQLILAALPGNFIKGNKR